jgi:uncharacterized membrane protein
MMKISGEKLLKTAFMAGAVTDSGALVPMLFPSAAKLMWGIGELNGAYKFAMGYGASLMLGWTILLLWAYQKPAERAFVAIMTMIVVCGLILTEILCVKAGYMPLAGMIPVFCLQTILMTLFGTAFFAGAGALL